MDYPDLHVLTSDGYAGGIQWQRADQFNFSDDSCLFFIASAIIYFICVIQRAFLCALLRNQTTVCYAGSTVGSLVFPQKQYDYKAVALERFRLAYSACNYLFAITNV